MRPASIRRANPRLKPGRDAATRRRHPWLFAGAVGGRGEAAPRLVERVPRTGGSSRAASPRPSRRSSPAGGICRRALDEAFALRRLDDAIALRAAVVRRRRRLPRGECRGRFLPGSSVDRYADVLAVQATTEGTERARPLWLPALLARLSAATVVQKTTFRPARRRGCQRPTRSRGESLPAGAFRERGLSFLATSSRTEDRLLPRPAGEPRPRPPARRGAARSSIFLLLRAFGWPHWRAARPP